MTEKRYYKKTYEGEYYIFDSNTITEEEFEEKFDYSGYVAFEDSLTGDENVDLLNNQHKEIQQLKAELQRMYDVGTLNKAIRVLEKRYDRMLSEGSDEIKDATRRIVLKCIEDLDEFKDDLTAR